MATPTKFQRAYVMLADNGEAELTLLSKHDPAGASIEASLRKLVDCGFGAVAVKLQDGLQECNQGLPELIRQRRNNLGIPPERLQVYGWGECRGVNPKDEAEKTNGLIAREDVAAWDWACEYWKGEPNSEEWLRARKYINRAFEIEPLHTYFLTGKWQFSYLPNEPAGHWIDWQTIKTSKARFGPECYPNQFPTEPSQWPFDAIKLAVDSGYLRAPKSYMHPLIGIYPSATTTPFSAYVKSLKASKVAGYFQYGYGVYLGHHMTSEDWAAARAVNKPAGTTGNGVLAWY